MGGTDMEDLQQELAEVFKMPRLSSAVSNVDRIIELLSAAREQVAGALDPHTASLTMAKLQNPAKVAFDKVNDNLKDASQAHKKIGKALNEHFPNKPLPSDHDAMANHPALVNRAIAMHLLREGQFSVASTFIEEAQGSVPNASTSQTILDLEDPPDLGTAEPMDEDADDAEASPLFSSTSSENREITAFHSQELQVKFAEMYRVLQDLKARNLLPAIEWARENSAELEARGSNLEFELGHLQYVWLFKGSAVNGLPDDENNGQAGAIRYAQKHFPRHQGRHLHEIQRLVNALAYASNLQASPYRALFETDDAFAEVSSSFTREFCSLLGLSAESPLYIAATAGALALPQLVKYTTATRSKNTEWTTVNELAFETPLPKRMVYHSIFVCPVSKEQTTEDNPPMIIPCGHVLAKETLQKLCKGSRFKCPYCPNEGQMKDARQIIL
ncbi:CTLH/CRA C-terminal to lish motif domain-containing protein [Podospora didyma]|uniref:GID complex catalytic subunit 2 n=1 Tax=Podospora didyma TaxID=330526 RepID=A0AAE0P5T9_9PEZI|nr:CTLH/CRA C-terminal to lish motif domain-containing protein [Podospora didyma]